MELVNRRDDKKKLLPGYYAYDRLFRRQLDNQGASSNAEKVPIMPMRISSDISSGESNYLEEKASTSGICSDSLVEEYVGHNGSLLSLQPWIFKRAKSRKKVEEDCDTSDQWGYDLSEFSLSLHGSPRRPSPGCERNISGHWLDYGYIFRPVAFSENFFMPHLHSKNAVNEQCYLRSLSCSSVKSKRRPFLIDRNGKNTRDGDSLGECARNKCHKRTESGMSSQDVAFNQIGGAVSGDMASIGFPHLPLLKLRKENLKSGDTSSEAINASCSTKVCKISDPQGSFDMKFFLLGVAIGVISSIVSNKMTVEKLNKLLEHNEGLVQDLHEELEVKDSLNTNELTIRTYRNQENTHVSMPADSLQSKTLLRHDALMKMDDYDNACLTKVGDNPEALSEIEAELEAELERLEQNMNSSGTGQGMPDIEMDLEVIENMVHGELREDLLNRRGSECQSSSNRDTSTASTTEAYNANYSVSPKELSLRLHKVIESRLEERIKELESAVEQSQMKLQLLEAEKLSSKQAFSSSETGSPNRYSPTCLQQKRYNPLCFNLSGDALNAYNEAYEEFMRLTESEDEKLPSSAGTGGTPPQKSDQISEEQTWDQILWGSEQDTSGTDDEDDEDFVDKEGKELIQKIVEKTKQGSPALINVQRMFFLMDF
ncbi:hypothetical protein HPP92_007697 [Vanilla planifolia]|uniref:Uncharacterized protein n=1 Tax=Vanilla planifolia TaxID=51239 RepID=A0A835RGJ4_VANPL|nr:hypothetical protein HPP92_007697 [Vanilla planifolia]